MVRHIALIPDGNRRWAKKKNLPSWKGHIEGAKALEKILKKAWEMKIPFFTFWGSSLDNIIKRPKKEIQILFSLYEKYFKKLLQEKRIFDERVKISVAGRWCEFFPKKLNKIIENLIKKTETHDRYFLTLLLAYNGTDEMLEAIKKISKKSKKKIDEKVILENLWTGFLPPVDLIIRTGSENDPHHSAGFMMWLSSYAQLHFTSTFFPDFSEKEFEKIVNDFLKKERRFGE